MADEALQEAAERLAQAEGLTSEGGEPHASNVTKDRRDGVFHHISRSSLSASQSTEELSSHVPVAAEAALAIARHLGPDASRDAAALAAEKRCTIRQENLREPAPQEAGGDGAGGGVRPRRGGW